MNIQYEGVLWAFMRSFGPEIEQKLRKIVYYLRKIGIKKPFRKIEKN